MPRMTGRAAVVSGDGVLTADASSDLRFDTAMRSREMLAMVRRCG